MQDKEQYRIDVSVATQYIKEQSDPAQERYVFAYTITMTNSGEIPAKLLSRHWVITDANNHAEEVRGEGVVGEHPHLQPGESFQYTSGTHFRTPVGNMEGTYEMVADDGTHFEAEIPTFTCHVPGSLH